MYKIVVYQERLVYYYVICVISLVLCVFLYVVYDSCNKMVFFAVKNITR